LPTTLAEIVTDFLIKYFGDIVDYDFTARAEKQLDHVAEGKLSWQDMMKEFYERFHPLVEKSAKADRAEAAQARELGKDPKTGKPVITRFGRYGPMLQLGETGDVKDKDAEKPRFAPLPTGATLDDVTLEQALPMFNLPRIVGQTDKGEEISADIGRFGPYIKVGKTYVSLKEHDPLTISEEQARQLYQEKQQAAAKSVVAEFDKIRILIGPYGPYVTDGKKNARINKSQDPAKLTEAEAKTILEKAGRTRRQRR
jgi:DNA topoisomerase-1